uniref:Uncharacterized protein n=1 Tax=Arundo donax TaxID=35708 RepID=A0A0A9D1E5_ARUDO
MTVFALSLADTPVVVPSFASTVTVKAVHSFSSFSFVVTIKGRANLSRSSSFMLTHTIPVPCLTTKAIASGVTKEAANMRSPSFSLDSSSTTITSFPCRMSSMASAMDAKPSVGLSKSSSVSVSSSENLSATRAKLAERISGAIMESIGGTMSAIGWPWPRIEVLFGNSVLLFPETLPDG